MKVIVKLTILLVMIVSMLTFISNSEISAFNTILTTWTEQPELPYNIANHTSFINNRKIYILGGATSNIYDTVSTANILDSGDLSTWEVSETVLPSEMLFHSTASKGNLVYILGGATYPIFTALDKVYLGKVGPENTITWLNQPSLPTPSYLGSSIVVGNNIYYFGGVYQKDGIEIPVGKVYVATINSDGTIESWHETTSLSQYQPKSRFGVASSGEKIFTIGGAWSPQNLSNQVFEAKIENINGNLGNWLETNPLPDLIEGLSSFGITTYNNYIIVAGGTTKTQFGTADNNLVFYTKILDNGSIDVWKLNSDPLPYHICCGTLNSIDNNLYFIGGYSTDLSGNFSNKVLHSLLTNNNVVETHLNVPDLKQISPSPWANDEYDSAHVWNKDNPTISRWGCAMTSADMLLQYYGYNLSPGELNNWLKTNSGYTRNGGILWPAISQFTKIHSDGAKPVLEFAYHEPNTNFLSSELFSSRPPILKMQKPNGNTHFMIATGITNGDFNINDPASPSEDINILSQAQTKWGENVKIGTFNPSHTDLSYMILMVNDGIDLKVDDPNGDTLGSEFNIKESPYSNPNNPDSEIDVETLNGFYYQKPSTGTYKVTLSGNGEYQLDSYLYNRDGEVSSESFKGAISSNKTEESYYMYISDSMNFVFPASPESGFDNLLDNLNNGYSKNLFKNNGLFQSLESLVKNSQKQYLKSVKLSPGVLLNTALSRVTLAPQKQIDQNYSKVLQEKIKLLINSL